MHSEPESCQNQCVPEDLPDDPMNPFTSFPRPHFLSSLELPGCFSTAYTPSVRTLASLEYSTSFHLSCVFVTHSRLFLDRRLHVNLASAVGLHLSLRAFWARTMKKESVSIQRLGRNVHRNWLPKGSVSKLYCSSQLANTVGGEPWSHESGFRRPSAGISPAGGQVWNISPFTWFISSPCKSGLWVDSSLINLT